MEHIEKVAVMLFKVTLSIFAVLSIASSVATASESGESVAFRSKEWQSLHAKDDVDADKTLAMLRKLGCETKVDNHGDHSDVTFRSVEWREITLSPMIMRTAGTVAKQKWIRDFARTCSCSISRRNRCGIHAE